MVVILNKKIYNKLMKPIICKIAQKNLEEKINKKKNKINQSTKKYLEATENYLECKN